jgi:hypothetical protein
MAELSELSVMNRSGDNKLLWDPTDPIGTEAASIMFKNLVTDKGYAAFGVKENGEKANRIYEFDKNMAKIIIVPPMKGG